MTYLLWALVRDKLYMSYSRVVKRACTHKQGEVWEDGCCHDVIFLQKVLNTLETSFAVTEIVADYLRKHSKHQISQESAILSLETN